MLDSKFIIHLFKIKDMGTKNFEQFNKELSWSTRIYTLATVAVALGAFVFQAWDTDFAFTIIVAIAIILFIETFAIYFHKGVRSKQPPPEVVA